MTDKPVETQETTMPDLLPCPFCGSTKLKLENLGEGDDWFVSCAGCEVQQIANYLKDVAVKRWNQRAVSPSLESTPQSNELIAAQERIRELEALLAVVTPAPDVRIFTSTGTAPPATETQPEEWSPAVKKAMKTFNDAWARRKAAEEDGADCSAGRLGATETAPQSQDTSLKTLDVEFLHSQNMPLVINSALYFVTRTGPTHGWIQVGLAACGAVSLLFWYLLRQGGKE